MTVAAALLLGGCTLPGGTRDAGGAGDDRPNPTPPASARADADRPDPTGPGKSPGQADGDLAAEIDAIVERWGGRAGAALAVPGTGGEAPRVAGELVDDVAWSTSKVPVAIAAVRAGGAGAADVTSAIAVSDNAAAESLWAGLGDPRTAAAAADAVLRDGGDATTRVNAERTRPEFTAFGQTRWALPDQARFGANLTCLDGAGPVVSAMGEIADDQRYGLGVVPGARFKGGWGPDESGMYLVRQFGTVAVDGGEVGVAIAARPADGTYETGQAMLTDIAEAVQRHMPAGGTC
ncbi:hypothetical protein ACFORJ_04330 [Corynebacterium hansenii]|uniref:Secreted protein n=1 Tax=Corynebacterium hansenii TaxID=394964 RepID=A0ABV7ZQF7_9CORY|nr:hypothetical protein [Corynebacterium hansenii]WJY98778.1 hypothetical protein CHAN_00675 [Corynebacterium hansenii]